MNYQITLLSPVHIGTGNRLTPFDYALEDDALTVMDLKGILLANPQRARELQSQVTQRYPRFSLTTFLSAEERQNPSFRSYSAAIDATTSTVLAEAFHKGYDPDVAEVVKTPVNPQLYIPGSSVKGAFRTALAYGIFRQDAELFQALKDRLQHVDERISNEGLNDLLFQGVRRHPHDDLFRALRISDSASVPVTVKTLYIGKMKTLSLYESRQHEKPRQGTMFKQLEAFRQSLPTSERSPLKPGWAFLEVLPANTTLTGELVLETQLLQMTAARKLLRWDTQHHKDFSYKQLITAANTLALDICQWELNFFGTQVQGIDVTPVVAFYRDLYTRITQANPGQCYVCLGRGAGWHKLTPGLLLENDPDFNFRKLRRDLHLAPHRLQFPYPKSRQLLMASAEDIQGPLGWICLDLM